MNQIYDEIVQRLSPSSFLRGINYNAKHVQLIKLTIEDNIAKAFFKVKSQREDTYYNTYVMFDRTHTAICDYTCTCMQYENFGECKHIAASILKYEEELIDGKEVTEDNSKKEAAEEETVPIVRTKRFAVKPMDPEEACMQMDLLGHSFYVFRNADTNEVNVVYKRKDGTFGLIEPEF